MGITEWIAREEPDVFVQYPLVQYCISNYADKDE